MGTPIPEPPYCAIILGGGGHARMLIDCLQTTQGAILHGVLIPDQTLWGKRILGVPVLGGDELLPTLAAHGVTHFAVGLGAVGNNRPRQHLFELAVSYGFNPLTILHPSAVISRYSEIGDGSQLLPGAILNVGARLGQNVIVNSGAIVEHDCQVGNHVHIATGAKLAGTVHVGNGAHIGAGATIRESIVIGEEAVVGAGAVVVNDVRARTVVVGVPAHVIREIAE